MEQEDVLAISCCEAADAMTNFILNLVELSKTAIINYEDHIKEFNVLHDKYLDCYKKLFDYCNLQIKDITKCEIRTQELMLRFIKNGPLKSQTKDFLICIICLLLGWRQAVKMFI